MKRIKIYQVILGILLALGISSCQDFLTLKPVNNKVVNSVDDYRDILASYMKFVKTPNVATGENLFGLDPHRFPYFDVTNPLAVYTGEVILNTNLTNYYDGKNSQYVGQGLKLLTWSDTREANNIWDTYYLFVGPLNLIIQDIDNVEQTNKNTRNFVKGEALVWRAFTYFKLLQYFSPYKNDKFGIPVYLKPYEDLGNAMPKRKTQTEVYAQIIGDCREALELLQQTPSSDWNLFWREDFINAMLASIYSYKAMSGAGTSDDWREAESYADKAIKGRQLTHDENVLKSLFDNSKPAISSTFSNDEFYVRIVGGINGGTLKFANSYYFNTYGLSSDQISQEYLSLFDDTDKRKTFYFKGKSNDKYNLAQEMFISRKGGGVLMPFRLAEMYLIKAESALRQGNIAVAQDILRTFKQSRYTSVETLPMTSEALLGEIILERKREFYQENDMVWLDMKRLGEKMERIVNGSRYILDSDDFRYSFPIPFSEMKRNRNMVQNPGWSSIVLEK